MTFIKIEVTNQSTTLTDAQVQAAIPSLQIQVHRDFAPAWGIDADLCFLAKGATSSPGAWMLGIFDTSDQAGALGYHELSPQGTPLAKVFAGSDIQAGSNWTITASHELLEMLNDPDIYLTVFVQSDNTSGTLYAYETCDAVEADSLGYLIDNVSVSDFVFPSWFESIRTAGGTQFDYGNHVTKPFQLLSSGYIGVFYVTAGSGWQQLTSSGLKAAETFEGRLDSRFERRKLPKDQWRKSSPKN